MKRGSTYPKLTWINHKARYPELFYDTIITLNTL